MDKHRRRISIDFRLCAARGSSVDNPDQQYEDLPAAPMRSPAVQTTNRGLWLAMAVGALAAILLTVATIL